MTHPFTNDLVFPLAAGGPVCVSNIPSTMSIERSFKALTLSDSLDDD